MSRPDDRWRMIPAWLRRSPTERNNSTQSHSTGRTYANSASSCSHSDHKRVYADESSPRRTSEWNVNQYIQYLKHDSFEEPIKKLTERNRMQQELIDKLLEENHRLKESSDMGGLLREKRQLKQENGLLKEECSRLKSELETLRRPRKTIVTCYTFDQGIDSNIKPGIKQQIYDMIGQKVESSTIEIEFKGLEGCTDKPVILFCMAASRLGTDVDNAVSKLPPGLGKVILIILHHKAPHDKLYTPSRSCLHALKDNINPILDITFWNDFVPHDNETNVESISHVAMYLKSQATSCP